MPVTGPGSWIETIVEFAAHWAPDSLNPRSSLPLLARILYNVGDAMILHPSQFDLGRPFDYISDLYTATQNGGSSGGSIGADARGIKLQPHSPASVYASSVVQRVHEVTPAAGKRILMVSRVFLSNATDVAFLYGFWVTDSDPFSSEPSNGGVLKKDSGALTTVGRTISGGTGGSTGTLFSFADETYIDVAVALHETGAVEFFWIRSDGTWDSEERTSNIPTAAMRASFAVRIDGDGGYAVVRSFYLHEEDV